jgi:hypothetical protein
MNFEVINKKKETIVASFTEFFIDFIPTSLVSSEGRIAHRG